MSPLYAPRGSSCPCIEAIPVLPRAQVSNVPATFSGEASSSSLPSWGPHILLALWAGGFRVSATGHSQAQSTGALCVQGRILGSAGTPPALRPVLLIP